MLWTDSQNLEKWRLIVGLLKFLNLVVIYFKFSPLNSLSKNLENCSRPTGSINSSRKLKPHRFTRLRDTSLLKLYNLGMLVPDEFGHVGLHK